MWITKISILAAIAFLSIEVAVTLTLTGLKVANVIYRTQRIAFACFTFRESVVTVCTNLTEVSAKILLAGTTTILWLTVISVGTIQITNARTTIGKTEMTVRTGLTVWFLERWSTLTVSSFFPTVSGRIEVVTVAS